MIKKILKGLNIFKNKEWKENDYSFKIESKVVESYFDKTQNLNFTEVSAKREEEVILPIINPYPNQSVLDLGCGNGRYAGLLIKQGVIYVGVDLSNKFITSAREKFGTNTQFISGKSQDYCDNNKYNIILIIGLITYMNDEDIMKLSKNCRKMLSKKGKLIVRSVALKQKGAKRRTFNYRPNLIEKLFKRYSYQIIRRSMEEEIQLFNEFELSQYGEIKQTGYTYYVFK